MDMPLFAEEEEEQFPVLPPDCFIAHSPSAVGSTLSDDVPGPSGLSTLPQPNTTTGKSGKRPADRKTANSSPAKRQQ